MVSNSTAVILSDRVADAFAFALSLHRYQSRKVQSIPYMAHLMSVAALVLEAGGTEDEAIAALLHDAVEDQGGATTRQAILDRYGAAVTAIVDACTEPMRLPDQTWREHKLAYLNQIQSATPAAQRVALADKLHNLRSLISNLRQGGDVIWHRFSGCAADYVWFYQSLVQLFNQLDVDRDMADELERCVEVLMTLV